MPQTLTTFDRIRKIIVEHLGVEADRVTPDSNIITDLGADSLDTVELVMAVEEHFPIEIPDSDMEAIGTVADLVALVDRLAG